MLLLSCSYNLGLKKGGGIMKGLHKLTFLLLVVGGLNWLLIGLFNLNVVMYLGDMLARVVYVLVGLSAVIEIAVIHPKSCRYCKSGMADGNM